MTIRSAGEVVVSEPKRYVMRLALLAVGEADEHHAAGDAAVEQQRQGHVAGGPAAFADQLDDDRAEGGHDHRHEHRGPVQQQAEPDAGERDVADAVADQGQPALHEVDAERRGGQPGDQRAEQRPLHEVVLRRGPSLGCSTRPRRAPPAAVRVHVVVVGSAWWPAGSGTAPSWRRSGRRAPPPRG